jgi:hypothetical protein
MKNSGNAPTVKYFYPGAEAPAKPTGEFDYHGQFWTAWYNTDTPSDGTEDETLARIQTRFRSDFQHCQNPIGMQVWDINLDEQYTASKDENADGKSSPQYNDAFYGYRCVNSLQTIGVNGNALATCIDVKVRFRCVPGITEMVGRIYTAVHGRED